MPGAASCTPAAVAQPPARFRSSQDAVERKAASPDAPIPTGLPRPRELCKSPRTPSGSVKAHSDVDVGPPVQQRGGDPANSTTRTVMPAGQPSQQARAPSIMELINQAVRRDEQQEALVRAGMWYGWAWQCHLFCVLSLYVPRIYEYHAADHIWRDPAARRLQCPLDVLVSVGHSGICSSSCKGPATTFTPHHSKHTKSNPS